MLILSLSTSGPLASAALICDGEVLCQHIGSSGRTHSETVMQLCEDVLIESGYCPGDVDAFAVDIGPGSFTGVRIGVCAANAMASAFNKPVIGVSSLEAMLEIEQNACALIDCRNGNGYAMVRSHRLNIPPSAVVISELLSRLPDGLIMVGNGALMHKNMILEALPATRFFADNDVTAAKVGIVGWKKLMAGEACPEVMPLYLRPSQAERLAKEKR